MEKSGVVAKWSPNCCRPELRYDALANSEPHSPAAAYFPPPSPHHSPQQSSRFPAVRATLSSHLRLWMYTYVGALCALRYVRRVHRVHGTGGSDGFGTWHTHGCPGRRSVLRNSRSKIPQPWMIARESGVMRGDQGTSFIQACLPCRHSTQNVVCSSVHSIGTIPSSLSIYR
jgi:hypothetical protein